jgi:predicted dehydrogenase
MTSYHSDKFPGHHVRNPGSVRPVTPEPSRAEPAEPNLFPAPDWNPWPAERAGLGRCVYDFTCWHAGEAEPQIIPWQRLPECEFAKFGHLVTAIATARTRKGAEVPELVQVGLGTWGLDWATTVLPEVPDIELVACVDTRPEALAAASGAGVIAERHCYTSIEDALRERQADAVLVTTSGSHGEVVRAALRARKHVLVEKPFVESLTEAQELVHEAAALDRTLMVSQNYRFFPAVRAVQNIVKSQELGRLLHVEVDFRRFNITGRQLPWVQPLLLDLGIHHFDLMRAVVGREPARVDCRAWNPPWSAYRDPPEAAALVDFEDGVTVSYRGSRLHPERPTAWAGEWRMEFEGGWVTWTSRTDRCRQRSAEGDAVSVGRHGEEPAGIDLPDLGLVDRSGALDAFTRALASGTVPETAAAENLGSLALAYGAIRSANSREPVEVTTSRSGGTSVNEELNV